MQNYHSGFITEKTLLPITQLFFGRAVTLGRPTLGRIICSGNPSVNGMPKSCVDLLRLGHTLTGLYSVAGDGRVESVYCDFSKLSTDPSKNFFVKLLYQLTKINSSNWIIISIWDKDRIWEHPIYNSPFLRAKEHCRFCYSECANSVWTGKNQHGRCHEFNIWNIHGTGDRHLLLWIFGTFQSDCQWW